MVPLDVPELPGPVPAPVPAPTPLTPAPLPPPPGFVPPTPLTPGSPLFGAAEVLVPEPPFAFVSALIALLSSVICVESVVVWLPFLLLQLTNAIPAHKPTNNNFFFIDVIVSYKTGKSNFGFS